MMLKLYKNAVVCCLLIAACTVAVLTSCYRPIKQKNKKSLVATTDVIQYTGFRVKYNPRTRQPNWVDYTLTAQQVELSKNTPKVPRRFMPDPRVPLPQAANADYSKSGWVRGHMARRQDMKWSEKAVRESDYFTNICPQNKTMNNGVWHQIENLVRRIAEQYDSVHVVCGPIFTDTTYGYIGQNQIPIPDYFFKTLLIKDEDGYHAIAFVCPNDETMLSINDVVCTLKTAKIKAKVAVYSYLHDDDANIVENSFELDLWDI